MIKQVLTNDEIQANADNIEQLIKKITRSGANIDELLSRLENSDFYTAPASTKYHGSYPGGLADHCLCVYHNLVSLVNSKHLTNISEESIIIVSLLHDLDKINKYEIYTRNVPPSKDCPNWTKEDSYKTKDNNNLFIYGNHEQNSEFLIRQYIPLTVEESVAILHHMGGMSYDSAQDNIGLVYDKYPLAVLLHLADMLSCYMDKA